MPIISQNAKSKKSGPSMPQTETSYTYNVTGPLLSAHDSPKQPQSVHISKPVQR